MCVFSGISMVTSQCPLQILTSAGYDFPPACLNPPGVGKHCPPNPPHCGLGGGSDFYLSDFNSR